MIFMVCWHVLRLLRSMNTSEPIYVGPEVKILMMLGSRSDKLTTRSPTKELLKSGRHYSRQ